MLTEAGAENAGAIDLGDGWCAVFKMESHNHPSAIEPYEGAATGVGGILRDIFAMGMRPVALLDSLRFGPLDEARNRHLFSGVVAGIGGYGNCVGVPTVGGEVQFDPAYGGNPLVNAMCLGVGRVEHLLSASARGVGNPLVLVGADTGRDGIHGATFASVELDDASEDRRPAVQVGNPFMEKLLLEACVELTEQHGDWVEGLQDLGAAGLTSSAVEAAARAGTGIDIDVARVPRREEGMTPDEVMLSESQERMLVIPKAEHLDDVLALFRRWELHADVIGEVTDDGYTTIRDGETIAARIPVALLTDPPQYELEGERPPDLDRRQAVDLGALPDCADPTADLLALIASPNLASRRWIYRQYDHEVLTGTVVPPGGDAALIWLKGSQRALAVATDCNGRLVELEPRVGAACAVAEAARNVVAVGATPVAVTDCLNFGNPERPAIAYQIEQSILGLADACRVFGTPVVSGNASLYNETPAGPVLPTPTVGMLGLLDDVERRLTPRDPRGRRAAADRRAARPAGGDPRGLRVPCLAPRPRRRPPGDRPGPRGARTAAGARRQRGRAAQRRARLRGRRPRRRARRVLPGRRCRPRRPRGRPWSRASTPRSSARRSRASSSACLTPRLAWPSRRSQPRRASPRPRSASRAVRARTRGCSWARSTPRCPRCARRTRAGCRGRWGRGRRVSVSSSSSYERLSYAARCRPCTADSCPSADSLDCEPDGGTPAHAGDDGAR